MSETRTMYSCKYYETNGVEELSGCAASSAVGYMRVLVEGRYWRHERVGGTLFETRAECVAAAKKKMAKKIKSLRAKADAMEKAMEVLA